MRILILALFLSATAWAQPAPQTVSILTSDWDIVSVATGESSILYGPSYVHFETYPPEIATAAGLPVEQQNEVASAILPRSFVDMYGSGGSLTSQQAGAVTRVNASGLAASWTETTVAIQPWHSPRTVVAEADGTVLNEGKVLIFGQHLVYFVKTRITFWFDWPENQSPRAVTIIDGNMKFKHVETHPAWGETIELIAVYVSQASGPPYWHITGNHRDGVLEDSKPFDKKVYYNDPQNAFWFIDTFQILEVGKPASVDAQSTIGHKQIAVTSTPEPLTLSSESIETKVEYDFDKNSAYLPEI